MSNINLLINKLFNPENYIDTIEELEKHRIIDNLKRKIILYMNIGDIEKTFYINYLIETNTRLTFIDIFLCNKNQFTIVLLKNLLPKQLLKSMDHERNFISEEIYYDDFDDIIDLFLKNIFNIFYLNTSIIYMSSPFFIDNHKIDIKELCNDEIEISEIIYNDVFISNEDLENIIFEISDIKLSEMIELIFNKNNWIESLDIYNQMNNLKNQLIFYYTNIDIVIYHINNKIYNKNKFTFIDIYMCNEEQFLFAILLNLIPDPILEYKISEDKSIDFIELRYDNLISYLYHLRYFLINISIVDIYLLGLENNETDIFSQSSYELFLQYKNFILNNTEIIHHDIFKVYFDGFCDKLKQTQNDDIENITNFMDKISIT